MAVSSLPTALRERIEGEVALPALDADEVAQLPCRNERQRLTATFRRDVVRIAKAHGVVYAARMDWRTQYGMRSPGEQTIRDWINAEKAGGVADLVSKPRSDCGKRRCVVTRAFDKAFTGSRSQLERIAREIESHAESLYLCNLKASTAGVARSCSEKLFQLALKTRLEGDEPHLRRVCRLPQHWAARFAGKKNVVIYDKDRKQHFDKSQPRIARGIDGMAPCELVYGDVHPADFAFADGEGRNIRVRIIAWLDHATRRMHAYPVFLTGGRGVRAGDIVEAFIALTQDPMWGMPRTLYLDNGSEYNVLDMIADAMSVSSWPDSAKPIVKAMPYNGPAKGAIEGSFAKLEELLAAVPGWIGGDRMKKKTHAVGKPAKPFTGTPGELRARIMEAVEAFNARPQTRKGALKGRSPDQAVEEARQAGWRRMDISAVALDAVFAKQDTRLIDRGAINLDGKRYYCDAFAGMFHGETVALRIPHRTGVTGVLVYDEKDRFLGVAHPDVEYHPLDIEGAKESGRRKKLQGQRIKDERKGVARIDAHADAVAVARATPAPVEPESGGRIFVTDDLATQAANLQAAPVDVTDIRKRDERDEMARIEREQERAFAKHRAARGERDAAKKRNREGGNPHGSIT